MTNLTGDAIAAGVQRLLPEAAPVRALAPLRPGRSHVSWVLESAFGALVGKVGPSAVRPTTLERLAEHRRVFEHGVPVPRLYGLTRQIGRWRFPWSGAILVLPGAHLVDVSRLEPADVGAPAMEKPTRCEHLA